MPSGIGADTDSVYRGHVTGIRSWMDFVDDGGAIGMRLLTDSEFQLMASGTPEQAQIWNGRRTTDTGGHSAYFLLMLDSPPKRWDFPNGAKITGSQSYRTCTVVSKITSKTYLCKNLTL